MVIKKAIYSIFHSDTESTSYHYETQAGQVKILDSTGNIVSSVEEMLLKGKEVASVNLNTLTSTGMYRVKNCTGSPVSMPSEIPYLFTVESTGDISKQTFYDMLKSTLYVRVIYQKTVGEWTAIGKVVSDDILNVKNAVGTMSSLKTKANSDLVNAINEVNALSKSNSLEIADLIRAQTESTPMASQMSTFSLVGQGSNFEVENEESYLGRSTGGRSLNIGKIDSLNNVVIGDELADSTIIQAKKGVISVNDGTKVQKLFHTGNMGIGSGLDADKVQGVLGQNLARRDVDNYLKGDQFIQDGKRLVLKSSELNSQSGSIKFVDSKNETLGEISTSASGDLLFQAGAIVHHSMKSTGELLSHHNHVLDNTHRDVGIKWRKSPLDKGVGFSLARATDKLNLQDWEKGTSIFSVDRADGVVNFANGIMVQGKKIKFQLEMPTAPAKGDIWYVC